MPTTSAPITCYVRHGTTSRVAATLKLVILARGLLFVAERGGRIDSSTYGRIWDLARKTVFTADVAAGPLAKRPYDLRHACVTFWLNLVKEPKRVAEWAGHSLAVLLREYAKCIDGGEQEALRNVQEGLGGAAVAFRAA